MGGDIGDTLESLHESEICESGRREVRYAFAFRSLDWDAYHRFRPLYPDSMWTTMFDYHSQRGSFGCALDLGTGEYWYTLTWEAGRTSPTLFYSLLFIFLFLLCT